MAEGDLGKSESDQNDKQDNVNDPIAELEEMSLNPNADIECLVEDATNEYENLNKTMDELDTWMTNIESRNDSLYSQLQELLQSSRETRLELQQLNGSQEKNIEPNAEDKAKS
ncbi:bublin coiled-coil protein-like [Mytilus edulis]|uniref:bublin coiled-coil protein-like n=1 Tax=Mytilus edulis TaxID=6550 RepID=UPI0039EEA318